MHKTLSRRPRTAVTRLPHLRLVHPRPQRWQGNTFSAVALPPQANDPVVDGIVHALRNHLQTISLGFDLLALLKIDLLECRQAMREIERASQVLQELRTARTLPERALSNERLTEVVGAIARRVAQEWEQPGLCLRVICPTQHPPLWLDWQQIGKALERVVNCAYALLPTAGGEVTVEADFCEDGNPQWIVCHVTATATAGLRTDEQDLFQPFLHVNGYPVGLSLIMVEQMVSRDEGEIRCCHNDPGHVCFTLLFPVHTGSL